MALPENQTGEYYFRQMKCSQKIKFKKNLIEYQSRFSENFNFIMLQKFQDFEIFVTCSFIFSETKEKNKYWFNVIKEISQQK